MPPRACCTSKLILSSLLQSKGYDPSIGTRASLQTPGSTPDLERREAIEDRLKSEFVRPGKSKSCQI